MAPELCRSIDAIHTDGPVWHANRMVMGPWTPNQWTEWVQWFPMASYVPPLFPNFQMTTEGWPRASQWSSEVGLSSLLGPHRGCRLGVPGDRPWDPDHWVGGPHKRRRWNGTGVWIRTDGAAQVSQVLPAAVHSKPKTALLGADKHHKEGLVGWLVLHGSPGVDVYFRCHQMITQQRPKGPEGRWGSPEKYNFSAMQAICRGNSD